MSYKNVSSTPESRKPKISSGINANLFIFIFNIPLKGNETISFFIFLCAFFHRKKFLKYKVFVWKTNFFDRKMMLIIYGYGYKLDIYLFLMDSQILYKSESGLVHNFWDNEISTKKNK